MRPREWMYLALCAWLAVAAPAAMAADEPDAPDDAQAPFVDLLVNGLILESDAQFHLAIAEASHNLVLVQVMQSLFTVVLSTVERNRHDMFRLSAPVTLQALTAQHQALMQAILDGDPQRARECIGKHLEHVRTTIQRMDEDRARRERSMRLPLDLAPQDLKQPPP